MPLFSLPAPLVLASTSAYRRAQLARLGVPFECTKPEYDEAPVPGLDPRALIAHHARQKAKVVQATGQWPDAWILAADQGVVLDEADGAVLLGKPGTTQAAVAQLLRLAGREHELHTVVVLLRPDGKLFGRTVPVTLRLRPLESDEAAAYVAQDEPLDCAGSYKIERAGPALLEWARGDDPTAIEGLPMMAVAALLREAAKAP